MTPFFDKCMTIWKFVLLTLVAINACWALTGIGCFGLADALRACTELGYISP